jgi:large subunit ribosomal protein L21
MSYAIITLGGKQYRVREGERLLVDKLATDEGATFNPRVLLVGGDGTTDLSPTTTVTARVLGHELGKKIRIGKYKKRTGYRKHNGYRSRLTQIQIESIGAKKAAAKKTDEAPKAEAALKAEAAPAAAPPGPPAPKAAQSDAAPKAAQSEPAPKAAQSDPVPTAEAAAEAPARTAHPPKDYDDLTVAQIAEAASGWRRPNLEAALEHERANANRKGAIAALESALAAKEDHS